MTELKGGSYFALCIIKLQFHARERRKKRERRERRGKKREGREERRERNVQPKFD